MFATALSALVDPREPSVTIACAGHPPPLLLRDGRVSVLGVDATMPILLMELTRVPDAHPLHQGDRLLFYTMGDRANRYHRRHVRTAAADRSARAQRRSRPLTRCRRLLPTSMRLPATTSRTTIKRCC